MRGTLVNEILIDKGRVEELEIKETRLMTYAVGFPSSLLLKDTFCCRNSRTGHVCLPFAKPEGKLGQGFGFAPALSYLELPDKSKPEKFLFWSPVWQEGGQSEKRLMEDVVSTFRG